MLIRAVVKNYKLPFKFTVNKNCIACGLCARNCPAKLVTIDASHVSWDTKRYKECELCLSCYHRCPSHAVNIENATQGYPRYIYPL